MYQACEKCKKNSNYKDHEIGFLLLKAMALLGKNKTVGESKYQGIKKAKCESHKKAKGQDQDLTISGRAPKEVKISIQASLQCQG